MIQPLGDGTMLCTLVLAQKTRLDLQMDPLRLWHPQIRNSIYGNDTMIWSCHGS